LVGVAAVGLFAGCFPYSAVLEPAGLEGGDEAVDSGFPFLIACLLISTTLEMDGKEMHGKTRYGKGRNHVVEIGGATEK